MSRLLKGCGTVAWLVMVSGLALAQPAADTTWREVVHPIGIAVSMPGEPVWTENVTEDANGRVQQTGYKLTSAAAAYQLNIHEWLDEDILLATAEDVFDDLQNAITQRAGGAIVATTDREFAGWPGRVATIVIPRESGPLTCLSHVVVLDGYAVHLIAVCAGSPLSDEMKTAVDHFLGSLHLVESDDLDGDGVPDSLDRCPEDAEDLDDNEDEDGCPEA